MTYNNNNEVSKYGLHFDEIYMLRVLDPEISNGTNELIEESSGYTDKLETFCNVSEKFISIIETFAKQVDMKKMQAIVAQNLYKAISKTRETEQHVLQVQLLEKKIELDRIKTELQYLNRIEMDQLEILEDLYQTQ